MSALTEEMMSLGWDTLGRSYAQWPPWIVQGDVLLLGGGWQPECLRKGLEISRHVLFSLTPNEEAGRGEASG